MEKFTNIFTLKRHTIPVSDAQSHRDLMFSFSHSGSYVNSYQNQQRRLQTTKNEKTVMNDYKNFVQNGGFGPKFGGTDPQTHAEKVSHL